MLGFISSLWAKPSVKVIKLIRNYESAKNGRRTDGWNSSSASANGVLAGGALSIIRSRTRDAVRNTPIASSALNRLAGDIVGTGIMPKFQSQDKAGIERIREFWDKFCETCDPSGQLDFYGLQNLAVRTTAEGGECLMQWTWDSQSPEQPLRLTLIEGDQLDHTLTRSISDKRKIIQGVEIDENGKRVAYHIFPEHPGEIINLKTSFKPERMDAKDIDHMFDALRPGQVRGVSWFAPVLMKINDINDYDEAEVIRKKVEACFSVFITKDSGSAKSALVADAATEDSDGRQIEELAPGLIKRLLAGESITFAQPSSNDSYADFLKIQLRLIAASLGIPYFKLTGDLSDTNYSSMRGGLLDYWLRLDHWQWHMVIPQFLEKTKRRVLLAANLAGVDLPDDLQWEWITPHRALLDPGKDINAYRDGDAAGYVTKADVVAALGKDPEKHFAELAQEQASLKLLGISVDTDKKSVIQKQYGSSDAGASNA